MGWIRPLLCCSLVLALANHAVAQTTQKTWELRGGQWQPVKAVPVRAPVTDVFSDPQLDQIERLIDRGDTSGAMKRCVAWLKRNKGSPARDRALFLMARALYRYGNRIKSFYYLDELLDEYPDSPLFAPALELQYKIADAYLEGYKMRFMYLPLLHGYDEAIEMLYRIQQRAPGSVIAEKALLRTADYFYADRQYDLAAAVYQFYAQHYPRSPVVPTVKLRQAFSNLAQFRGPRFDPTPWIDARTQLLDVAAQYPQVARDENIAALLRRIDAMFARKLYITADYYKRTHEPKAAAYLYQYLVQAYPGSPEAQDAQRKLQTLPAPDVKPSVRPQSITGGAVSSVTGD